jgi:hypothetical protein
MHVRCQRFAKGDGVRRKSAASVPLNCNSFSNWLATMRYSDNSQSVSVRSLKGGDDRYTLPNLCQSEQGVRCTTLEQNVGLDVCETARCIEQSPDGIARIQ